jgi:hypothetical protein
MYRLLKLFFWNILIVVKFKKKFFMEENINEVVPPVQQNVVVEPVKKGLSKLTIFFIILFLVLLLFGAGVYAGYFFANSGCFVSNTQKNSYSSEQDEFEIDEAEEKEEIEYLGTYIDTTLPEDWEVVEYMDGEGSDMLVSGSTYSGLTGLGIFDEEENEVFKLYAVDGIGGIEVCSEVAKFPDTPQSYIEKINDLTIDYNANTDADTAMPVVVDINIGEYTSFNFIDYVGRRVDDTYYWNGLENANPSEFHPLCGMSGSFLVFKTLSFELDNDGFKSLGYSYGYELVKDLSEEKLLILDSVMNSIVLK